MKRLQLSIRHIMISIAVIGVLLGTWLGAGDEVRRTLFRVLVGISILFLLPATILVALLFVVHGVSRQRLWIRIQIEVATLLLLLAFSSILWRPVFYTREEQRCLVLARLASEARGDRPEDQATLAREAAWFSRRASALRWRGLWLGLTRGPSTGDEPSDSEFINQMGILETNEKHQKTVERCSSKKQTL